MSNHKQNEGVNSPNMNSQPHHINIAGSVSRMRLVVDRLDALKARITTNSNLAETPDHGEDVEKPTPSLQEVLENTPASLNKLKTEACDLIDEIEAILFVSM